MLAAIGHLHSTFYMPHTALYNVVSQVHLLSSIVNNSSSIAAQPSTAASTNPAQMRDMLYLGALSNPSLVEHE